ncbi:polysaccharide biosynthesis tyrosine autokinase [Parasphingorhabdus sp.]|uniref:polysaccharide biosynthesis tyrosine autokinase n=1 Tax=Parasphingorhabdus sp. TaxID=2709688 RepID=UPI003A9564F9
MTQFESEYPAVKALTSQLNALDSSIASEDARARSTTREDYNRALRQEQDLREKVAELKGQYGRQRSDSIQYNIYQREVDTNRELYDGLLQRYKEIGVAGVGNNNVAIVDKAKLPSDPSSPKLALNLALSLLFGIGSAAAYVLLREQLDQSLKDPSDAKTVLGLAPLGSVPDAQNVDLIHALKDKKSMPSEAYFSIATNLSFLTENGAPKSFLLTSTQPNEGKSTSAFALASALARTHKHVLLLDADMRNPSIHMITEEANERGLSNYLVGYDNLDDLILPTENASLSIMPAGPTPPNAAELLSGNRFSALIAELNSKYDHVIVDAPPVLAIADVPLLSRAVEGVLYVVQANGAKMRTIQTALDRVQSTGARVFGAIVTKLDSRNSAYGYDDGHGYGYHYGKRDEKS